MPGYHAKTGHGGMKRNRHGETEHESDMDTGYLWGKAGQDKAKKDEAKRNSGYRMWENQKRKKK